MYSDKVTRELGDLFVYNLNVDFQERKTTLEFG